MIVRVRFLHENLVIHKWSIFMIPDATTLLDVYCGIKSGTFSCGKPLNLTDYHETEFIMYDIFSVFKV